MGKLNGKKGQLETDIQKSQSFDWDEDRSSLSKSEAGFQVLRHICDELFQQFPNCICGPQVSDRILICFSTSYVQTPSTASQASCILSWKLNLISFLRSTAGL